MADDDITRIRQVISHDAFDQGAFSGAVLAEQSVKSAGLEFQGNIFVRDKRSEPLGDVNELESRRPRIGETRCHADRGDERLGVCHSPKDAALHLDHLQGGQIIPIVRCPGAIREHKAFIAAVIGLSHGGVNADVGGNAGKNDF